MVEPSELNRLHAGRSLENVVAVASSVLALSGFGAFCLYYLSGFLATAI